MDAIRTRPVLSRSFIRFLYAVPFLALAFNATRVTDVAAQGVTIGLYADPGGTQCSFSGDATGLITTYVVVRPDPMGVTGVRFKAQIPECFQATYVGATVAPGMFSIGDVQTGISIATGVCVYEAVNVLEIQYMRNGGTSPCCEFTLTADPLVGSLEAVDCAFTTISMVSAVSHFNADASCACDQSPPLAPFNPSPVHTASDVSLTPTLTWQVADYDSVANYDVYFGVDPTPSLAAAGLSAPSYQPDPLAANTTYYWRVVVRDVQARETSGPVWMFMTTIPDVEDVPPYAAFNPVPGNQAVSVSRTPALAWGAFDPNYNLKDYDVYLGTSPDPPLVAAGIVTPGYEPPELEPVTQYYWHVTVRDSTNFETPGPLWTFSTNHPPSIPLLVTPANGATNVDPGVILTWMSSDEDGETLTYDIHFGTNPSPPMIASGLTQPSFNPQAFWSITYYWRVVAHDHPGSSTSSPVWSFTTGPLDPSVPRTNTPDDGETDVRVGAHIAWVCTDPQGDPLEFDVYFGTDPSPPLVVAGHTSYAYDPPGLMENATIYYWRIVSRDPGDNEVAGPVWSFTTRPNSPPDVPEVPSPGDQSTWVPSGGVTLQWVCSDPDQHPITYDVYLGTDLSPPLVATNVASRNYQAGPFTNLTQYHWKVVARDSEGAESAGPVWTFTTTGNQAPTFGIMLPAEGATTSLVPELFCWVSDPDGPDDFTRSLYFGTTNPPPFHADNVGERIVMGPLQAGTTYYWRVVADDGEFEVSSKTQSFSTVAPGDVDANGSMTLDDAACALEIALWNKSCNPIDGQQRADVNCDQLVTPADARCIHKNILDGSCEFCSGGTVVASSSRLTPVVSEASAWIEWDTLIVRLDVSNVPSLKSFGFRAVTNSKMKLGRILRAGPTTGFEVMDVNHFDFVPSNDFNDFMIGGYTLGEVDASNASVFVELRMHIPDRTFDYILITQFMDDMAGAPEFKIFGTNVPVLFSAFKARPRAGGVEVSWELQSDEAMQRYTLYRRQDHAVSPVVITQGAVTSTTGSYFDRSVTPGATYHYELAITTVGGEVFRSPVAKASVGVVKLALYQNHPNPFNPQTTIRYDLPPGSARVRLWILDVAGHIVRTLVDENQPGGPRTAVWKGEADRGGTVASGVYFYVLDVGGERLTKKLVLLK